jgi:Poly(ADP-ribose) polymerase catalytic domain
MRSPLVQEFHLFHGTDIKYLQSILSYNLDCQFVGRKKGSKFGKGVYFSPLSSYSLHYTDRSPHHSIMILFRVLTVKQCIGFEDSVIPDDEFDTAVSENGKVWIKFDMDEVYPDYVIHFKYNDPEDKAVVYGRYRAALEKKHAEKYKMPQLFLQFVECFVHIFAGGKRSSNSTCCGMSSDRSTRSGP